MNLIDALKAGKRVRRPIKKHWGASKTGWLDKEWVIEHLTTRYRYTGRWYETPLIDEIDLMSEDWESKDD